MIESKGFINASQFCKEKNITYVTLNKIINLREIPINKKGEIRKAVIDLATALNCLPEELFSAAQMETALESNQRTFKVQEAEMRFMIESKSEIKSLEQTVLESERTKKIDEVLNTLTPREKKIIEMRFGLEDGVDYTLEEVGLKFDVNRERVRQIEAKAIRKLRHPSRSRQLQDFIELTREKRNLNGEGFTPISETSDTGSLASTD